jgi:hypothetical protein
MKAAYFKIITSFMLCIATLPLIFAGYIQIDEAVIHHQMKEELKQKNLITVHVKSSQITWTEKGEEARINGNMFDVAAYKINGDDIEIRGLFDKDEDALFAQIDTCNQKNNCDAAGSTLVLKWFSCFSSVQKNNALNYISAEKDIYNSTLQNIFIKSPFLSFDTPPPKPC